MRCFIATDLQFRGSSLVGRPLWCRLIFSRTDMFSAGVAVLGVEGLETSAAIRPTLFHDVALATQDRLALETAEVFHVPVPAFCLRALIREDDLRGKR